MNIIERYLGKAILNTILIVLFAIGGIELFIMMIGEIGDIGRNHYTSFSAFIYVLLNLPDGLYQFFPMVGLIGMLMGLGILANHSELIIMQSSGLSPLHITYSTLKTVLVLLLFMSIIGEVIAPKASEYATIYKEKKIQSQVDTNIIAYDVWLRLANDFLYVKSIDRDNKLHQLTWYHFGDQNQLLQADHAQDAIYNQNHWIAYQVSQTAFQPNATIVTKSKQTILPFIITPNLLLANTQNPSDLSLSALHQSMLFHQHNHLQNDSTLLSFWRRILQPATSLVMMLLAIPFIFGPLRHVSNNLRLVIGIIVGFCFYYLNAFFGPIVLLFHWPPLLGALLPTLIFGTIGVLLLYSARS